MVSNFYIGLRLEISDCSLLRDLLGWKHYRNFSLTVAAALKARHEGEGSRRDQRIPKKKKTWTVATADQPGVTPSLDEPPVTTTCDLII